MSVANRGRNREKKRKRKTRENIHWKQDFQREKKAKRREENEFSTFVENNAEEKFLFSTNFESSHVEPDMNRFVSFRLIEIDDRRTARWEFCRCATRVRWKHIRFRFSRKTRRSIFFDFLSEQNRHLNNGSIVFVTEYSQNKIARILMSKEENINDSAEKNRHFLLF